MVKALRLSLFLSILSLNLVDGWVYEKVRHYRDVPEEPVETFRSNVVREDGVIGKEATKEFGRPLRDYDGQTPKFYQLKTKMERVSKIGQPLAMRCEVKDDLIERCSWTNPAGNSFEMTDLPEGIEAVINDEKVCQIQISSLQKEQLGKWKCKIELNGNFLIISLN